MPSGSINHLFQRYETKPTAGQNQVVVRVDVPGRVFTRHAYFLVTHDGEDGVARGSVAVRLENHEEGWLLSVKVPYSASLSKNGLVQAMAERAVSQLGKGTSPQEAFESTLRDAVLYAVETQGGLRRLLSSFENARISVVREVTRYLEQKLGLNVGVRLEPTVEGALERVKRVPLKFTSELVDYASIVDFDGYIELEATDDLLPFLFHQNLSTLATDTAEVIKRSVKHLTLHQVHYGLDFALAPVRDRVAKLAADQGRVATTVVRATTRITQQLQQVQAVAPATFTFDKRVTYPRPVKVDLEFNAKLTDLGKYSRQGLLPLKQWAERTLRDVIEANLLDVSYINLFLNPGAEGDTGFAAFDRKVEQTKVAIRAAAREIGHEVAAIEVRTDLDFDELRRSFAIAMSKEMFDMNVPDCQACLTIQVKARINDEAVIQQLFRRSADIKGVIEADIREKVSARFRKTSPEAYFLPPIESELGFGISMIDELREEIAAVLREKYVAHEILVSCTPERTKLEELFIELRREQREIRVAASRVGLTLVCTFRVKAIASSHWYDFQTSRPSIAQVETMVSKCVLEHMNRLGRDNLLKVQDQRLKDELNAVALGTVEVEYGLSVGILHVERMAAPEEDALRDTIVVERTGAVQNVDEDRRIQIESLRRQRAALAARAEAAAAAHQVDELRQLNDLTSEFDDRIAELLRSLTFASTGEILKRLGESGGEVLEAALSPEPYNPPAPTHPVSSGPKRPDVGRLVAPEKPGSQVDRAEAIEPSPPERGSPEADGGIAPATR